ncbi:hypothetical protein EV363DRAFT_1165878, partial [Boletus edulis]
FNLVIAMAGGDRATWAVDDFLDREAMDLHLKGQLDRTMSTNNFAEIPCILCRLNQIFRIDDITLNSHPDVAAFQLIRQVTPASV